MKDDLPNREQDQEQHAYRIASLLAGYVKHTLNHEEMEELEAWLAESEANLLLFEEITSEQDRTQLFRELDKSKMEKARERMRERLGFAPGRSRLWLYGAAASIVVMLGLLYWFELRQYPPDAGQSAVQLMLQDVQPGTVRATLTLADGSQVTMTDSSKGWRREQPGGRVNQLVPGLLEYEAGSAGQVRVAENRLTTPRGGRYRIRLPDGTLVWLNAASSLRYPTIFQGPERTVYLRGEAYFEVRHNKEMPFRVLLDNGVEVEVLGTRFNIMAYNNEPLTETTLLEGSVLMRADAQLLRLRPGEKGSLPDSGRRLSRQAADTLQVLAWQRNEFHFVDAPLRQIMRQVERWYDVDVVYRSEPTQLFTADVSRTEPVSHMLKLLELTNQVHFKIENKTIYVLPG